MSENTRPVLGDRYELLYLLGQGGMAKVMLARDLELGREVAVKLMSPELVAHPRARERFEREAVCQARVEHPHVVRIYDFDLEGETPYLAMEYVVGRDLDCLVRQDGPLPLPRLERLARELGAAVDALHDVGMVHRDLKPANVMIRNQDGSAVIMDLGLVHTEDMATLTETGSLVGSPRYMPPEVLRSGRWQPESDRWALGAILFEAATGLFLVQGRTLQDLIQNAARAAYTPFPPTPAMPRHVMEALARAVSPHPAARFPRGLELAAALAAPGPAEVPSPTLQGLPPPAAAPPADAPATVALPAAPAPGQAPRTSPPPPRTTRPVLVALVVLCAFGAGFLVRGESMPEEVQWSVLGDAVLVRCRPGNTRDLALALGERRVAADPVDADGTCRLVLRDLPPGESRLHLVWRGGQGPDVLLTPSPPALREPVLLGPDGSLRVEVLRPCRVRVGEGPPLPLEPGAARVPRPAGAGDVELAWEEEGLESRRTVPLRLLHELTLAELERGLEGLEALQTMEQLVGGTDPEETLLPVAEAAWSQVRGCVPGLLQGPLPRPARARLLQALSDWQRLDTVRRALRAAEAPAAAPVREVGARGSGIPAWEAVVRTLPVRPRGGTGHHPEQGMYLLGMDDLNTRMSGLPATVMDLTWPADMPADARRAALTIRLDGLYDSAALRLQGPDPEGNPVTFHLWHPAPRLPRNAPPFDGWISMSFPADLGPAPGAAVTLQLEPLVKELGGRVFLHEVRLMWDRQG